MAGVAGWGSDTGGEFAGPAGRPPFASVAGPNLAADAG